MASVPIPPSASPASSSSPASVGPSGPFDPLAEHRARQAQENDMLDQLHASVTMTQHKAKSIGQEIKDQDPMLRQLGDNIDNANMDVQAQNRTLGEMLKDSKERNFFVIVCVLILVIVVLVAM